MDAEALAADLTARGYRRISNRYRIVARIDRPDWVNVLAEDLLRSPAEFYVKGDVQPDAGWEAYYLRCCSNDKIEGLDPEVFKRIPGDRDKPCGYVPPFARHPDAALLEAAKVVIAKHDGVWAEWSQSVADLAKAVAAIEKGA